MDRINTIGDLRRLLNAHPEWDEGKVVTTPDEDFGWQVEELAYNPTMKELILYRGTYMPGLD